MQYRHAKHAGNFGDVIKHLLHVQILNYLNQQARPVAYLESHSGPGLFKLANTPHAKYHNGIGKLWKYKHSSNIILPPCLQTYLQQVEAVNPPINRDGNSPNNTNNKLIVYPGSPVLAQTMFNKNAHLNLYELQAETFNNLANNTLNDSRIHCFNECGFKGVLQQEIDSGSAIYLLIDPPYEQLEEYQQAINTLLRFHEQYPKATIALWYPVINRQQITHFERQLMLSGIHSCELFEINTDTSKENTMTGAGMLIVNPPSNLFSEVQKSLPLLARLLASNAVVDDTEKTNREMSRCVLLNNLS